MGTCCGAGPLLGAIGTYTNGLHTPAEAIAHGQAVATCVNQDHTAELTADIRLVPANDTVTIEHQGTAVPWSQATIHVFDRTVGQDQQVAGPLAGNGVQLTGGFAIDDNVWNLGGPGAASVSRRTPNANGVGRRNAGNIANTLQTNASSAVIIVDMCAGMYERYGGEFVFEAQRGVLNLAMANNRPILEVVMRGPVHAGGALTPTCGLLTSVFWNYAHLTVFEKPGAGGANSRSCLECTNVVRNGVQRITGTQHAVPATTLVQFLDAANVTDVVVMGYNANQCVGATIFGRLSSSNAPPQVNPNAPPASIHSWEYEMGLLDFGFTVHTSREILGSGGSLLGNAYTT